MEDFVVIDGNQYAVAPLKCKHLREVSEILRSTKTSVPTSVYEDIDRWTPFVLYSIQKKNPDFTKELLEDATLTEFLEAWQTIISISGIRVVQNAGELTAT